MKKCISPKNLTKINAEDYFPQLIHDIIGSVNINKQISENVKVDSVEMSTKMMVPLGLQVNEVVLNSMKHAFKNAQKGEILFHFINEDGKFKMLIGDNGSGIELTQIIKKNSLGMGLIESFVDQLDGTVKRIDDKGTLSEIYFGFVDLK